jgi:hypothetical protein
VSSGNHPFELWRLGPGVIPAPRVAKHREELLGLLFVVVYLFIMVVIHTDSELLKGDCWECEL